jgi:hypothetical protein
MTLTLLSLPCVQASSFSVLAADSLQVRTQVDSAENRQTHMAAFLFLFFSWSVVDQGPGHGDLLRTACPLEQQSE